MLGIQVWQSENTKSIYVELRSNKKQIFEDVISYREQEIEQDNIALKAIYI